MRLTGVRRPREARSATSGAAPESHGRAAPRIPAPPPPPDIDYALLLRLLLSAVPTFQNSWLEWLPRVAQLAAMGSTAAFLVKDHLATITALMDVLVSQWPMADVTEATAETTDTPLPASPPQELQQNQQQQRQQQLGVPGEGRTQASVYSQTAVPSRPRRAISAAGGSATAAGTGGEGAFYSDGLGGGGGVLAGAPMVEQLLGLMRLNAGVPGGAAGGGGGSGDGGDELLEQCQMERLLRIYDGGMSHFPGEGIRLVTGVAQVLFRLAGQPGALLPTELCGPSVTGRLPLLVIRALDYEFAAASASSDRDARVLLHGAWCAAGVLCRAMQVALYEGKRQEQGHQVEQHERQGERQEQKQQAPAQRGQELLLGGRLHHLVLLLRVTGPVLVDVARVAPIEVQHYHHNHHQHAARGYVAAQQHNHHNQQQQSIAEALDPEGGWVLYPP